LRIERGKCSRPAYAGAVHITIMHRAGRHLSVVEEPGEAGFWIEAALHAAAVL